MSEKVYNFNAEYATDEDDFAVGVSLFDQNDSMVFSAWNLNECPEDAVIAATCLMNWTSSKPSSSVYRWPNRVMTTSISPTRLACIIIGDSLWVKQNESLAHQFRTMSGSTVTAAGFARTRITATSARQTANG